MAHNKKMSLRGAKRRGNLIRKKKGTGYFFAQKKLPVPFFMNCQGTMWFAMTGMNKKVKQ